MQDPSPQCRIVHGNAGRFTEMPNGSRQCRRWPFRRDPTSRVSVIEALHFGVEVLHFGVKSCISALKSCITA
jgi:hypothetical protein